MKEHTKQKVKIVDTEIGMKFIVGLEENPTSIHNNTVVVKDHIPVNLNTTHDLPNQEFFSKTNASSKRTYSYGYVSYIWYGLISVLLSLILLYFLLKK